jgi:hypothetical protein
MESSTPLFTGHKNTKQIRLHVKTTKYEFKLQTDMDQVSRCHYSACDKNIQLSYARTQMP